MRIAEWLNRRMRPGLRDLLSHWRELSKPTTMYLLWEASQSQARARDFASLMASTRLFPLSTENEFDVATLRRRNTRPANNL